MNERLRFRFLILSIIIAFGFTIIRLAQTTLFPDKRLRTTYARITNPRGNIYDRRGRLIAGVSSTSSLYARPNIMHPKLREYIKNYLLSTGYFSYDEIDNFDKTNKHFVYIKRDMTPSILKPVQLLYDTLYKADYIKKDEIGITAEESRFYPYPFLSPIIGILGRDGIGLYGIEYTLDKTLAKGHHITLSLDADISRIASEELNRIVVNTEADGGSVVIMDITNRAIITLAQISSNSNTPLSLSHIYEPGSVMKMFTAAFAMEQGLASTTTPLFNDHTPFKVGDYTFSKPSFGYIPLSMMLKKSANISFARLANQFGSDDYYLWLTELGFGKKPSLPLTSLEKGILHEPKRWSTLSKHMMALGQEIGVTSIQLLIAASIILGNGQYITPTFITSIKDINGNETYTNIKITNQLFHPQKAKELLYTLEGSVSLGGTGVGAMIEDIRIAGKTGTGMIAGVGGYSTGKNNTTFIGILPIENPSLLAVVVVHNPKGHSRSGGGVSAPLFARIIRRILLSTSYNN